ncbi:MAG TPA: lipopolysaccharide biosynthesis protein [Candidatus Saccharimonadales bacterium]|nr:lipopolysaccharide biosynthesis protein [Candidatus Saccharimonadales bacterium]
MSLSARLGRHSLIYGVNVLASQALSFLLIPVYTRTLEPADYGALEVLNRTAEVMTVVGLAGLRLAVVRFVQDPAFRGRRSQVVGSAVLAISLLGGVLAGLLLWRADAVAELLLPGRGLGWAVRLMAAGSLFDLLTVQPMALLQADQRSTRFVTLNLARFVLGLVLNLALVAVWRLGLRGILVATLSSAGAMAIYLQARMLRAERPEADRRLLRELLRFGLPFVPGGLFLFILNNGDRYFLARMAPPEQVGLYALGYRLGTVILFLFVTPVMMNWNAMMVEIAARPDGRTLFSRVFTLVMAAYLVASAAFSLLAPAVLAVVAGPHFQQAAGLVPWVCLAYFFWTASLFFDTPFYLARKTGAKPLLLGTAAALNLWLYATLIPRHGMYGAAWATVVAFAFFAWLTWAVSRRHLDVPYAWGRLAALLGASAASVAAGMLVPMPTPAAGLAWRALLAAALAAAVWWGLLPAADRTSVLQAARGLWGETAEGAHGD